MFTQASPGFEQYFYPFTMYYYLKLIYTYFYYAREQINVDQLKNTKIPENIAYQTFNSRQVLEKLNTL